MYTCCLNLFFGAYHSLTNGYPFMMLLTTELAIKIVTDFNWNQNNWIHNIYFYIFPQLYWNRRKFCTCCTSKILYITFMWHHIT